jgi:NADPH-dependent ferric siderophore reductase
VSALTQRLRAKLIPTPVTVVRRSDDTPGLVDVWCVAARPFQPGHVLALRVDGEGPGPTGTWRRYTIAETDGNNFRLLIQRNPGGAGERLFAAIASADVLSIRGPEPEVMPPTGVGPLLVVADLTGLATVAAVLQHERRDTAPTSVAVHVNSAGIEASAIGGCLGVVAEDVSVHGDHAAVAEWIRHRVDADHSIRLLGVGEYSLVAAAKRAAIGAGVASTQIRSRVYWKPGRRGLE